MKDKISYFSNKWQLTNIRMLEKSPFTQNEVAVAFSAVYKKDVVLKLCQNNKELLYEQRALHFFDGRGCVRLLAYDKEKCSLLLEYIQPGIKLKTLFPKDIKQATTIAAEIIKKLHSKRPSDKILNEFPTINKWLESLYITKSEIIPNQLLKRAQILSEKLVRTQQELCVLHGDLHHENILQKGESWVAIDPKGAVGELAYEFGAFIRNPIPQLLEQKNPADIIEQRIQLFSDTFDIDKQRLRDWSFVQAVLAACWSDTSYFVKVAEIIDDIRY